MKKHNRMTVADLDQISATRMVVVAHVSGHILNVNTKVLDKAGFSPDSNLDGLVRDGHGRLTGELQGPAVMGRANRATAAMSVMRSSGLLGVSIQTRAAGFASARSGSQPT